SDSTALRRNSVASFPLSQVSRISHGPGVSTMKRSFALVVAAWGLCAASALAQAPQIAARPAAMESFSYYDLAATEMGPEQQSPEQAPIQAPASCAPAEEEKVPCLSPS